MRSRLSAGKQTDAPASLKPSSSRIKTACRDLTVRDYIEMVCFDNNEVLAIGGNPSKDELNAARMTVLTEFAKLSGSGEGEAGHLFAAIVNRQRKAQSIEIILRVFASGMYDDEARDTAYSTLTGWGIRTATWGDRPTEADIRRVDAILLSEKNRLAKDIESYNKLAAKNEGKKITESDVRGEMVAISLSGQLPISDECNLATYAAYRKSHIERAKALEAAKHAPRR